MFFAVLVGFNSMKVRLKRPSLRCPPSASLFQFHEGPIKTQRTEFLYNRKHGFNSMKVRLKPTLAIIAGLA